MITVPHTWGGTLAKLMRLKEDELFKLTGYRLKITERVGPSIKSQLVKSDPWAGRDCDRQDCLLCITKLRSGKNLSQNCHKRNAVYETWCETCKVRDETKAENDKNIGKSDHLPPPGPSVGGEKADNDNDKNCGKSDPYHPLVLVWGVEGEGRERMTRIRENLTTYRPLVQVLGEGREGQTRI